RAVGPRRGAGAHRRALRPLADRPAHAEHGRGIAAVRGHEAAGRAQADRHDRIAHRGVGTKAERDPAELSGHSQAVLGADPAGSRRPGAGERSQGMSLRRWVTETVPDAFSGWLLGAYRRPLRFLLTVVILPLVILFATVHAIHVSLWQRHILHNLHVTARLAAEIVDE